MDNLNPRFLLMGWMFAKNAFWAQSSHEENDSNAGSEEDPQKIDDIEIV